MSSRTDTELEALMPGSTTALSSGDDGDKSSSSERTAEDETSEEALPSAPRPVSRRIDKATARHFAVQYARSLLPPVFKWYKFVTWSTLRGDVLAGLTIVALLIPQAVAYAQLAGLNARFGFYAAGVPAIVYALLGTSHCAAVGPVALSSLVSGAAVTGLMKSLSNTSTDDFESASIALGFLIGILQLLFGVLRLGIVVRFLSNPVLSGFTTAAGISIAATQLKHLFGVKVGDQPTVFHTVYYVASELPNSNVPAVIISAVCLAFLLVVRWAKRRFKASRALKFFPEQLFVMVVGTIVSYAADLSGAYGTRVVGALPQAFPLPTVPDGKWMGALFVDAIMLSLIGFTESISVSTLFADKAIYKAVVPLDASQELVALGAAKVVGAFFSGFTVTGSLSRTAVADAAGSVTPLSGMLAGILMIFAAFLSSFIAPLPQAVLAASIMVACLALLKFGELRRLWGVDKRDMILMLLTIGATLGAGVSLGLLISVSASLVLVVLQSSRAHYARVGLVPGTVDQFRDVERFRNAIEIPRVAIVRYDARLFFANAPHFRDVVSAQLHRTPDAVALVLDFSSVNSLDSSALEIVDALIDRLENGEPPVRVVLACCKGPVRDRFDKGKHASTDKRHFNNTVRGALLLLGHEGVVDLKSIPLVDHHAVDPNGLFPH
jgi:SulP family sulfate permease